MKRLAEAVFNLQQGERGTALMLAGYHFVLLLCLYLLKPVRDGLFLTDRGTGELPFVFVLVAVTTIPVSLFQRRLGRRFRLDRLTNRLTLALVAALVGVSGWALSGLPGGAYAVYVFVSIYGVMATSQFWLFAGGLLTSAQSKRTFSVLNLGGILGAVAGGELTGWLLGSTPASPHALLFLAAALLAATFPLAVWIRRYHRAQTDEPLFDDREETDLPDADLPDADLGDDGMLARLRETVGSYPLVGWIAALIAVISVVSTLLDYQLKTVALTAFPGEAEVTAFLGRFYGRVSLVALALQLLLSTGLQRYVRSTSALYLLPAVLVLGTTALALVPALAAVTFLRGADQSLKHSIDKTAREILYLPLPQAVKRRIKVPLDLVVDQAAYGMGGLLLLGLTAGLGLSAVELGPVVGGLGVVWMLVVYRARRQYLDQYRDSIRAALDRRQVPGEDFVRDEDAGGEGEEEAFIEGPIPPAGRERALQNGGRYLVYSQLLALRTGAEPPDGEPVDRARLPTESVLRRRRRDALDALFEVLLEWIPKVQSCPPDDLRLAAEALHHPSADVRSDAVSLLDGLLSGSIRRRLVPLLDDRNGHRTLKNVPPLYRFYLHTRAARQPEEGRPVPASQPAGG